jgi:DNA polymerase-3 subunit epsilon
MRQIILDTETTGLDPALGHRVLEIAGVEVVNRRLTGNNFHRYINPGRDSEDGALQIHGLTAEFLADKPRFGDIVAEFLDYVSGAELVIHNAAFDVAFLDHELRLLDRGPIAEHCPRIVDSLQMARDMHPGKRNSLDALCDRYQVDHSARTMHDALLDATLLAEVYLAMTRGQESLAMEIATELPGAVAMAEAALLRLELIVVQASEDELAAHARVLTEIDGACGGACLWRSVAGDA